MGEKHVLRLDVAVDDELPMRIVERARHVTEQLRSVAHRELSVPVQPVAQGFTLDERHGVVQCTAVENPGGEEWDDMRMLKTRGELDLAPEPLHTERFREIRAQNFDDDLAPERRVGGEEDPRHATARQLVLQRVCAGESVLQLVAKVLCHGPRQGCRPKI